MRNMLSRWIGKSCEHQHTLVVRSVGVQRSVCEGCDHVSFTMVPVITTSRTPDTGKKADLPRVAGL